MASEDVWRRCSACKKPITLGSTYWTCSVSTCNRKRTGLAFCTVTCWDVHLPGANHREAWAEEQVAPRTADSAPAAKAPKAAAPKAPADTAPAEKASGGRRRLVRPESSSATGSPTEDEVLIVASRLKAYVRAASGGFNTSDRVLAPLSAIVRRVCDEAIANARREGRMTVLDRDVPDA